ARPEQVARMRVGVEEALAQDLPVEGLEQLPPGLAPLGAVGRLANRHALDELQHEQAGRREFAIEARYADAAVRRQHLAHPLDVRGLLSEVELPPERLGEVADERRDVDGGAQRLALERLCGEELEEAEVADDLLSGVRALY